MAVTALTVIGALLADRTRATVLVALMDGRARTAGELARHAQVAPSTMSGHLAQLAEAGLVAVVAQGRHRYVRIVDDEIGRMLEHLGGLDIPVPTSADTRLAGPERTARGDGTHSSRGRDGQLVRAPQELRFAHRCYDHLAGELGVRLHESLLAAGHIAATGDGGLGLTTSGRELLADLDAPLAPKRPAVRPCLDWTERRDHLGGAAAAALLTAMLDRGWLLPGTRPRSLRLTEPGRHGLADWFDL